MTIEEMLAEILVKLEEMPAPWWILSEPPTPSPSSIPTHIAGIDEDQERGVRASASFPSDDRERALSIPTTSSDNCKNEIGNSTTTSNPVTAASATPNPSPTSAPSQDTALDSQIGVDRLSRLPDPLLRDIVSRLPIKDAARTAVLSRRWSPIWCAAPLLVDPVDSAVLHLNRLHMLHELDLYNNRLVSTADQERVVCSATTSPASPIPSSLSAPPWGTAPAVFFAFPENVVATQVRCSTLGLYQIGTTLMPATTSSAAPMSTSTAMLLVGATITKHLFATLPTSINHRQGNKMPKPPWLLGTEVSHSWYGRMQLISGFLLEVSPWCRDYTLWVQWQQYMTPTNHVLNLLFAILLEFEPWPPPIQRLCIHLVSSYAFQLEGDYGQLDWKEGNLTYGHCKLLKYAIHYMVLASKTASESIKSGWLLARVNLCLPWKNMSAYQLYSPTGMKFILVWLRSYKENVELSSVASSKDTSSRCLIVYRNGCRSVWGYNQLDLEKGHRADQHLVLFTHFGGHEDLTMLHQLGIFIEFSDSVDTYRTPHDIKYAEAVTRVQIQRICWHQQQLKLLEINKNSTEDSEERQPRLWISFQFSHHDVFVYLRTPMTSMLSELWVKAYLHSIRDIHQSIICQPTIQAICTDLDEGTVRADRISCLTLPVSTHTLKKAVATIHIGSSLLPTVSDVQILEIVAYHLPCKGNRVVTQVLIKWAGLLLVDISTWEATDQVLLVHSNLQPCVLVLVNLSKEKLLEHLTVVYQKIGVEQFVATDRNYCYLGSVNNELQTHTCGELVIVTRHIQNIAMPGDTTAQGLDRRLLYIYHKRKGATASSIQEHTGYLFIVILMSCMMRKFGIINSLHSARGRQQLTQWSSTVKAVYIEIEQRAVSVGAVVCQLKLSVVLIKRDGWLPELSTWKDADQILHKLSSSTAWGQAVFQGEENVTVQAKTLKEGIKTKWPRKPNPHVAGPNGSSRT